MEIEESGGELKKRNGKVLKMMNIMKEGKNDGRKRR